MSKKKADKKEPKAKAEKKVEKEPKPQEPTIEEAAIEQAAEPAKDEQPKAEAPPEPPAKPTITYEELDSSGTDDQFEYVRVNVKVSPPFNGFDEAIITVPVPIHNSKGMKQGDREALIREKALWKVNSQVGQGAHQFKAEDVKSVREERESNP